MTLRQDYPYSHALRVRYSEIDAQGVVFNAHYLTFFDVALNEYLRDIGFDYHAMVNREGLDFHLVKSTVEYLAPIRFDEVIDVAVRPGRIGRSSITWELAVFRENENECLSRGEIIWVCARPGTHRSHPLPDSLLARLPAPPEGGAAV